MSLIFTIFGATGDLTFRKLIPAVYSLYEKSLIDDNFSIIGFARRDYDNESFKKYLDENVDHSKYDGQKWRIFLNHINYICSDFNNIEGFRSLSERIKSLEMTFEGETREKNQTIKVFYLSTGPEYFKVIAENIKNSDLCKLCKSNDFARVVIEKPYGTDPKNTQEVDELLRSSFSEEHIYRIDHFLGKESLQNILVFRFANSIFERLWNKDNIEFIQIKADEKLGVENRGGYYDKTGAIKDMVPNHILQILSLVTMDSPDSLNAKDIQNKRLEIIQKVFLENKDHDVVRGQYEGYLDENNVDDNSNTETFAAMKLYIDNPKWIGVPIYIRTGKKMEAKLYEISIKFKDFNKNIYDKMLGNQNDILTFRIQPDEGISIMVLTKEPGDKLKLTPVTLDFCYRPTFSQPILDSYVGLLQNIIYGDQSLFTSIDEVKAQWQFMDKYFSDINKYPLFNYSQNSEGPIEAFKLLENEGKYWIKNELYTCALRY